MSKYPCLPNLSATGHLEPKMVMFTFSSWWPYWNSRWQPIYWSAVWDPAIFLTQHVKIPLYENFTLPAECEHAQNWKFQCRMAFRTQDSNHQCFVMAAILEFKMAVTRFVRRFKLIHCWTQHVKIPLFSKFQCHRSFGTKDSNVQRFVMAAILEFKMAADPVARPLGSGNFWTQHVKIPLYAKFQLSARCEHAQNWKFKCLMAFRTQ